MDPHRTTAPSPSPRPGPRLGASDALQRVAEADALLATVEGDDAPDDPAAQAEVLDAVHRALQDAMTLAEG